MSQALFAGWRPDEDGRRALSRTLEALLAARPVQAPRPKPRRPDQWHVTLSFIGRGVGEAQAEAALRVLSGVAARIPPHAFRIARLEHWTVPAAVVAVPEGNPELQALCDDCTVALRRAGIRPLQRTTQPHVTLAYFDKGTPAQPWLAGVAVDVQPMQVDGFELLFNPGGHYRSLAYWPLTGARLPTEPEQPGLF